MFFLLEHNETTRDDTWSDNYNGTGSNWLGLQLMIIRERKLCFLFNQLNCDYIKQPAPASAFLNKTTIWKSNTDQQKWQSIVYNMYATGREKFPK